MQLVGEYFPALQNIRVMYQGEALRLLWSGRGRLANKFFCVGSSDKHSFQLQPGQGVQLYLSGTLPQRLLYLGEFFG